MCGVRMHVTCARMQARITHAALHAALLGFGDILVASQDILVKDESAYLLSGSQPTLSKHEAGASFTTGPPPVRPNRLSVVPPYCLPPLRALSERLRDGA